MCEREKAKDVEEGLAGTEKGLLLPIPWEGEDERSNRGSFLNLSPSVSQRSPSALRSPSSLRGSVLKRSSPSILKARVVVADDEDEVEEDDDDDAVAGQGNALSPAASQLSHAPRQRYQRVVLGLAARAVAVECFNSRFLERAPPDSCFCVSHSSPVRKSVKEVVEHKHFMRGILALIVLNSITLALDSPDNKDNEGLQDMLQVTEIVFVVLFALEAVLKIFAWGMWGHRGAYLRNPWNWLDLIIVLIGGVNIILPAFIGGEAAGNVSGIRLLRILRPLRTVSRIAGMRQLIQTLAASLPSLGDVFLLLTFLLLVFAIAGIQLWSDTLHRRCYLPTDPPVLDGNTPCSTYSTGRQCPNATSVCLSRPEIFQVSYLNFNHIGSALLFVFKIVSLDDWPEDMWLVQDTFMHAVWVFFFILVLTSAYFAVNLFLAVLSAHFFNEQELSNREDIERVQAVTDILKTGLSTLNIPSIFDGDPPKPSEGDDTKDTRPKVTPPAGQPPVDPLVRSSSHITSPNNTLRIQDPTAAARGSAPPPASPATNAPPTPTGMTRQLSSRAIPLQSFSPFSVILREHSALVLNGNLSFHRRRTSRLPIPSSPILQNRRQALGNRTASGGKWEEPPASPVRRRSADAGNPSSLPPPSPRSLAPPPLKRQGCLRELRDIGEVAVEVESEEGSESASNLNTTRRQHSDEPQLTRALTDTLLIRRGRSNGISVDPGNTNEGERGEVYSPKVAPLDGGNPLRHLQKSPPPSRCPYGESPELPPKESELKNGGGLNGGEMNEDGSEPGEVLNGGDTQDGGGLLNGGEQGVLKGSERAMLNGCQQTPLNGNGEQPRPPSRIRLTSPVRLASEEKVLPPLWHVYRGKDAFPNFRPVKTIALTDEFGVPECRDLCLERGWGGFLVFEEKASFKGHSSLECINAICPAIDRTAVLHLVVVWDVYEDMDAFPGDEIETKDASLVACARYCIRREYGGFAVGGDGTARYRHYSSAECARNLSRAEGMTFYLPHGCKLSVTRRLVIGKAFNRFMLAITILNVIALGVDHHGIDPQAELAIEIINMICTIIFTFEILAKIHGLGLRLTFLDPYNVFDAVLVAIGIPQLIVNWVASDGGGNLLSIFRILRVARVLRLGRRWKRLRNIIRIVLESLSSVIYLSLLLLLLLFIFSILGMQLFGGSFPETERLNFSSLWRSILTVFVVVTGEGWAKIMRSAMTATGSAASLYFVALFVLGRYIILNLFIAIIINQFQQQKDEERMRRLRRKQEREKRKKRKKDRRNRIKEKNERDEALTMAPTENTSLYTDDSSDFTSDFDDEASIPSVAPSAMSRAISTSESSNAPYPSPTRSPDTEPVAPPAQPLTSPRHRTKSVFELRLQSAASPVQIDTERNHVIGGMGAAVAVGRRVSLASPNWFGAVTCGCFTRDSAVRNFLTPLVLEPWFEKAVVVLICLNLAILAAECPATLDAAYWTQPFFFWSDVAFTIVFFLEMVTKMVVMGIWTGPHSYLRDLWNVVDFVVVIFSVVGLFVPVFIFGRSFRVFRLVTRSENAKVVLYATVGAMPSVANGLVISGFAFVLFAVLGVQLLKGDLVACNDPTITFRANCTGNFTDSAGFTHERSWGSLESNFDHAGSALFTLFKVALSESWVQIMFSAVDSSGNDVGPQQDHRPEVTLYFIFFFIIANFLCLNLIISILISAFSTYHEARFYQAHNHLTENAANDNVTEREVAFRLNGWQADIHKFKKMRHQMLTDGQKNWVRSQKLITTDIAFIPRPRSQLRLRLYQLADSQRFEWAISIVIIINLILLSSQHRDPSDEYNMAFSIFNFLFIALYIIEFVIKLVGFGPKGYFTDNWCRYDFVVLVISVTGVAVGENLTVFRVMRIGRVLRLFHMSKGLNKMFTALLYALPPLFNIGVVLCCVFFVFGLLGVDMFGELNVDLNPHLHRNMNFENLAHSILLLFQISTAEMWLQVLEGCRVGPPYCVPPHCGTEWAIPYFVIFMVLVSFLMVNLFVAVVLEAFQDADQVLSNESLMQSFRDFRRSWLEITFARDHTNDEMEVDDFIRLIRATPAPLGPSFSTDGFLLKLLKDLNIPVDEVLRVHYADVVHALARVAYGIQGEEAFKLAHLSHVKLSDDMFTVAHVWCVRKIGKLWREHAAVLKKRRETNTPSPRTSVAGDDPTFSPFTAYAFPRDDTPTFASPSSNATALTTTTRRRRGTYMGTGKPSWHDDGAIALRRVKSDEGHLSRLLTPQFRSRPPTSFTSDTLSPQLPVPPFSSPAITNTGTSALDLGPPQALSPIVVPHATLPTLVLPQAEDPPSTPPIPLIHVADPDGPDPGEAPVPPV